MKYSDSIDQRLTGRHKKSFQFVGSVRNRVILDIGCSYGWFERWAIGDECRKIVGIEPKEADLIATKQTIPDATFINGSALSVPFGNEYFDIVVMWEVLEHLPENTENQSFKEITRLLKQDGSLFLSTPNKTFWSCVLDPAWWIISHRHYNIKELNQKLSESGFKIVKIEYCGGFYELFGMILLYISKWLFRSEVPFKTRLDKKRDAEFLEREGFTNIFLEARKSL